MNEHQHNISDRSATPGHSKQSNKVNFRSKTSRRRSINQRNDIQTSEDYSEQNRNLQTYLLSQGSTFSINITNWLDDDPFEYEIVNIHSSLLNIPEITPIVEVNDVPESKTESLLRLPKKSTRRRRSSIKYVEMEEPHYAGGPNAFMIELYGLRDDIDERKAFDLLQAAFECMESYDYCIIRIPCSEKSFPLLQHFCYVPSKRTISEYALYIAHRSSVFGKLRVRKAEIIDIPRIAMLLQDLDGKETVYTVEDCILNQKEYEAYVFMSGLEIVGVAIIEPPEQLNYLRAMYNMDLYHTQKYHNSSSDWRFGFSNIKTALVYPVFDVHFRFFLRELMRHSDSTALLWLTAYRNKWAIHKANTLASAMIPLLPRKSAIDIAQVPEFRNLAKLRSCSMAFSTWFIGKRLTSVPKLYIDTRIVIIGASRTAMSFMSSLLFSDSSTYLSFTSVTLISPQGLPYLRHANKAAEHMFLQHHTSSDLFLKSAPFTYYVNVVHGTMVEINKQSKYVKISSGGQYYYDLLFLLFGKQYQHPEYMKSLSKKDDEIKSGNVPYVRLDTPRFVDNEPHIIDYKTPDNVFIINTISEASKALSYCKNICRRDETCKIIVYGSSIHAYCCITALLESNICREKIIFVEPFPPEYLSKPRVSIFANTYVDDTVRKSLKDLDIKIYSKCYFKSWKVNSVNLVTHVEFLLYSELIRLDCTAFFYYGKTGVNPYAFYAINKCGLAYDGGILIDHEFRTKDLWIYAAGPLTRYYRKYFAEAMKQKYYDSYEVGKKLGDFIRNKLDPIFIEKNKTSTRRSFRIASYSETIDSSSMGSSKSTASQSSIKSFVGKVPELKKPIVWHCVLPGGLQYLEVRSPGTKIPHHYMQSLHFNSYVLETYTSGYFKLHLNHDLVVDGITCLTYQKYSLERFKEIYGLSSVVLNNVFSRFTTYQIDDLFEYFHSPWSIFLYHEQVDELFAMIKELLPKNQPQGETIGEALRKLIEKMSVSKIQSNTKSIIRSRFEKSPYFEVIMDFVLDWVSANDAILPMYYQPWYRTEYMTHTDHHPAFARRKRSIRKMLAMIY